MLVTTKKFDKAMESFATSMDEMKQELSNLQCGMELNEIIDEVRDTQAALEELEWSFDSSSWDDIEYKLDELENVDTNLEERIESLEYEVEMLKEQIEELMGKLEG